MLHVLSQLSIYLLLILLNIEKWIQLLKSE